MSRIQYDRLPRDFEMHVPDDDGYDHDLDDPEFYRGEEWFDDGPEESEFDQEEWERDCSPHDPRP